MAGIIAALIPFVFGVALGTRRSIHVNRYKKQLVIVKSVGSVVYSRYPLPYKELNYVSVFKNSSTEYHEARLFYDEDQYLNLFEIKKEEKAVRRVHDIADALSIPVNNLIVDNYWADKDAPPISAEEREISAYLSEADRPAWQSILAAVSFTVSAFCLYFLIRQFVISGLDNMEAIKALIILGIVAGGSGVKLSMGKSYLFDFKNHHYKLIHRIGPFQYGKWKILRQFEYVSLRQLDWDAFEVNLWFNKSRHFNMGLYGDYNAAKDVSYRLAVKFEIDLLDSAQNEERWTTFEQIKAETILGQDAQNPFDVKLLDNE